MLPGDCRTCVINADRRSIRIFSITGPPVRKTISSIAQIMKTCWAILEVGHPGIWSSDINIWGDCPRGIYLHFV